MLSFRVATEETARTVLKRLQLISFAESLGGVESLITLPALQTHGDMPEAERLRVLDLRGPEACRGPGV